MVEGSQKRKGRRATVSTGRGHGSRLLGQGKSAEERHSFSVFYDLVWIIVFLLNNPIKSTRFGPSFCFHAEIEERRSFLFPKALFELSFPFQIPGKKYTFWQTAT